MESTEVVPGVTEHDMMSAVLGEMFLGVGEDGCNGMHSELPDSGERSEFSTGAVRDASQGKGIPSEIYPDFIRRLAVLLEKGAEKYSRGNWRKGIPLSRYIDSITRHTLKLSEGDKTEDHAAAIAFNVMGFIYTSDMINEGKLEIELNDLPFSVQ